MFEKFSDQGYIEPIRVLSPQDCQAFLQVVSDVHKLPPLDWDKGNAVSSRAFYDISTHPVIIDVLNEFLGQDIILWGASMTTRSPNEIHPWHSDIESSATTGKTVSVWIGLEDTNRGSSLLIIPYSHRFGVTVQEVREKNGKSRDETTNDDIVRWAQELDKRSHLVRPDMTNGEALFFDGKLWHGSRNLSNKTRRALLLQYSTPDAVIRIPDLNYLNWPFHQLNLPKPPCILIRGSSETSFIRFVSAPVVAGSGWMPQLTSRVYPLKLPLPPDEESGWKPYPIFYGSTGNLRSLSCHASVLTQNSCPHPPHAHDEEEILMLLAGEAALLIQNENSPEEIHRRHLKPGQFVYYPAHFSHTLQTTSREPANYLMFKWEGDKTNSDSKLTFGQFDMFDRTDDSAIEEGFCPSLVFEGPTAYLRKLHCHTSTLTPGAGYDPHIDAYDVAIVVFEGEVETLGELVGPHGVIFYPGGEPHGMYNPGNVVAKYVVFEFHRT
ncbi:MAG: phytanoyl-CoA dioxygenase family protein [Thermodesulfobacteriota bacterium]